MKPIRARLIMSLILIPVLGLTSQENETGFSGLGVPPAPVVSSLAAEVSEATVKLTWLAAPEVRGTSEILRANFPITAANEASAERRGTVEWSVTEFTDTLEAGQEYWYAVVSVDSDGSRYGFFLPASNALIMSVRASSPQSAQSADISSFSVRVRNDAVGVSWTQSVRGKNLVLYRSTEPFIAFSSLLRSVLVSAFSDASASYTDYPVPGVPYYYALLDEDDVHRGSVAFTPGLNTNAIPVEIPSELAVIKRASVQPVRPMPLPFLNPSLAPETVKVTFSRGTETKISMLLGAPDTALPERKAYVFRSDMENTGSGGDDFALRNIIIEGFASDRLSGTIAALDEYLSLRRGEHAAARAHFYRGEALYFSEDYEGALLEFLLARDIYANQAGEWIQYTLAALTASD